MLLIRSFRIALEKIEGPQSTDDFIEDFLSSPEGQKYKDLTIPQKVTIRDFLEADREASPEQMIAEMVGSPDMIGINLQTHLARRLDEHLTFLDAQIKATKDHTGPVLLN